MTYGREQRFSNFTGLELRRKEARNDFSALEFSNIEIIQVGTAKKRDGIVRTVDQTFPRAINAIIPTRNCYFLEQFVIGNGGFGNPGLLSRGLPPQGCGKPDPLLSIALMEGAAPLSVTVTWVYPKDKCVEGVRIVRRTGQAPTGPEDANADKIVDFQRRTTSFVDFGVVTGVQYFYTGFCWLEK